MNEKWSLLLFDARCCSFLFLRRVSVCLSLLFAALSLLVFVFEIESVLSQKSKQANAFGC